MLRSLSGITSNRFLMHYLNRFDYRNYVNGTTRLKLTQGSLRTIPVVLPSLPEQERIVKRIEEIFVYLGAIETNLKCSIEKLKYLQSAILTDAFRSNLDLPSSWDISTIGQICDVNPRFSKVSFSDEMLLSFIPMSAVEAETCRVDISDERTMGELRHKSYRGFRDGDILVAKITPSMENGKVAVVQGLVNGWGMGSTEFHVLRPHAGVVARYIAWFTLQNSFRVRARMNMTGTAGQLRVPAEFLRNSPIPLPPVDEQRWIVQQIDKARSKVSTIERSIQDLFDRISIVRQSVLAEAFAGRLVPQDPEDEPASVLLERIAASRPAKPKGRNKARA